VLEEEMRVPTRIAVLGLVLVASLLAGITPARAMPDVVARGYVWLDTSCDGLRQADEPYLIGMTIYLFAAGADGIIHTPDDQVIEQSSVGFAEPNLGKYRFTLGTTGLDYALVILPRDWPVGLMPGPLHAGADRSIDNDMRADWMTGGFQMHETETVTGVDVGLCRNPNTVYLPLMLR
jgi:hypothetical protein